MKTIRNLLQNYQLSKNGITQTKQGYMHYIYSVQSLTKSMIYFIQRIVEFLLNLNLYYN